MFGHCRPAPPRGWTDHPSLVGFHSPLKESIAWVDESLTHLQARLGACAPTIKLDALSGASFAPFWTEPWLGAGLVGAMAQVANGSGSGSGASSPALGRSRKTVEMTPGPKPRRANWPARRR